MAHSNAGQGVRQQPGLDPNDGARAAAPTAAARQVAGAVGGCAGPANAALQVVHGAIAVGGPAIADPGITAPTNAALPAAHRVIATGGAGIGGPTIAALQVAHGAIAVGVPGLAAPGLAAPGNSALPVAHGAIAAGGAGIGGRAIAAVVGAFVPNYAGAQPPPHPRFNIGAAVLRPPPPTRSDIRYYIHPKIE